MSGTLKMVDVGDKRATARRALTRGSLRMGLPAFKLLQAGRLPKGDALRVGEIAGLLAAKNCSGAIPLCHPLPLDKVRAWFEFDAALPGVHAFCEVKAFAKTGVEMEALCGVNGALLAVYDLVKQVDAALTISDIRLEVKEGGKSGVWTHPESKPAKAAAKKRPAPAGKAAVITVSDRVSKGRAQDASGRLLAEGLRALGFKTAPPRVVSDDAPLITAAVRRAARRADVVVLTGGTGLSPRDVTPETVAALCDRLVPGVGEALRAAGQASTPRAILSRSLAGQLGRCLIVCLPGSRGGVRDGLKVLEGLLPHAVHIAQGGDH
ncbi:MAG: bifunctional molybdenum cofactor biosynthesis protein MoaC/MoaB [Elusimicrobiota bacterium]